MESHPNGRGCRSGLFARHRAVRRIQFCVGVAFGYQSLSGKWKSWPDFGYGIEAARSADVGRSGWNSCEIDLHARRPGEPTQLDRAIGLFPQPFLDLRISPLANGKRELTGRWRKSPP